MTVSQAASIAGVCVKTAYDAVKRGELEAYKDPCLTVTHDAVRKWSRILNQRRRTACRTESEVERLLAAMEGGD
ncbi:MAG: helix-turn-helix domain-containing protein [Clostridia bacterium]|nr:helix-turn-helix domain-containing protein [Clostridia bacterium]